jgi:hypothetical protein
MGWAARVKDQSRSTKPLVSQKRRHWGTLTPGKTITSYDRREYVVDEHGSLRRIS